MQQLLYVLRAAKFRSTGPTLIHVCTKKDTGMHQRKTLRTNIMVFQSLMFRLVSNLRHLQMLPHIQVYLENLFLKKQS